MKYSRRMDGLPPYLFAKHHPACLRPACLHPGALPNCLFAKHRPAYPLVLWCLALLRPAFRLFYYFHLDYFHQP